MDVHTLASHIKQWGKELGFQQVGIADIDLSQAEPRLMAWLAGQMHGDMAYMARHGTKRSRPAELEPGTLCVISLRMDYLPPNDHPHSILADARRAYVARYALGRDYHKMMRKRLQTLATRIAQQTGPYGYRVFVDSAPVLEKPLAEKAGLGWAGKHTNLVHQRDGGWFFLGEIYSNLPLPSDEPGVNHCGRCTACIDACPTQAIIAPYQLDARRCISYLTIEYDGPIPLELRPLLGNRIYGCDDCLLACPWNRFAKASREGDFLPRQGLDQALLTELVSWDEAQFLQRTEGSPIRRIGHRRWIRNLLIALGNGPSDPPSLTALEDYRHSPDPLVAEHARWALERLQPK